MIARVWHGYTKPEHADAYEAMLKPELLPGISKKKGYKGSYLLRQENGNEVEFITIMLWDSIDSIRAAAGPDYETAIIPEERRKHLSRYDATSAHYEVASVHGIGAVGAAQSVHAQFPQQIAASLAQNSIAALHCVVRARARSGRNIHRSDALVLK